MTGVQTCALPIYDIVATTTGTFLVVFCGSSRTNYGANSAVLYKTLPSAWVAWQTVVTSTLSELTAPSASLSVGNQLSASTELAASRDEDGTTYVFAINFATGQQTQIAKSSTDIFDTWVAVGTASVATPNVAFNAGGYEWVQGTVSIYNGTIRLVSQWDSATWPGQIGITSFAGYATACMPWSPAKIGRAHV